VSRSLSKYTESGAVAAADRESGIIGMMKQGRDTVEQEELVYVCAAEQVLRERGFTEVDCHLAREAGYWWPVRIGPSVKSLAMPKRQESAQGHSLEERLRDVLRLTRRAVTCAQPEDGFVGFGVGFGGRR